jgi:LacI family transcriptional regulator
MLKDVARAAGVDSSTASRILNDRPIRIRPETRATVVRLAAELGYTPSAPARGLRVGRTGAIGLLVADLANPVYATIERAAVARAEELGYAMLIGEIRRSSHHAAATSVERLVRERRIDGLVIAAARGSDELIRDLLASIPHVFAHRRLPGTHCVTLDEGHAAGLAAGLLAALGHERLGIVGGPDDVDTARRRVSGFRAACRELGLRHPIVELDEFTAHGGHAGTTRLLTRRPRPTGLFVSNLLAAVGSLAALHEAGLDVPQDASVVGYGDAAIAEFTIPPLTTVSVSYDALGRAAVEALDAVLRGERPGDLVVPSEARVIERRSTGPRPLPG